MLGPADRLGGLVVIAPAHRAGDPGSNPGPGNNFFSSIIDNNQSLNIGGSYLISLKVLLAFRNCVSPVIFLVIQNIFINFLLILMKTCLFIIYIKWWTVWQCCDMCTDIV